MHVTDGRVLIRTNVAVEHLVRVTEVSIGGGGSDDGCTRGQGRLMSWEIRNEKC